MEIIFVAKRNLATFSLGDLKLLTKYYDVDPSLLRNDLLWILAINIHKNIAKMPPGTIPNFKTLETFDDAMLIEVAINMNLTSINKLCRVSKRFNEILCENADFWRRKYMKDHGEEQTEIIARKASTDIEIDWKHAYKERYQEGIIPKIKISAGNAHALGITQSGKVICWGDNSHGQAPPEGIDAPEREKFVQVAAGGNDSFGLTNDGKLFAWGESTRGKQRRLWLPKKYANEQIIKIAQGGRDFRAVLTKSGIILQWAYQYMEHTHKFERRGRNKRFIDMSLLTIPASPGSYILAITDTGDMVEYSFTGGEFATKPSPDGEKFVAVASAKKSYTGSVLGLTDKGTIVWITNNNAGKLRLDRDEGRIIQVEVGQQYAVALTDMGIVTIWGKERPYSKIPGLRFVRGSIGNFDSYVVTPKGEKFVEIAAGSDFILGLTDKNRIVSWGNNDKGQAPPIVDLND